jgi:polyisoprenoid-binding protein YceI
MGAGFRPVLMVALSLLVLGAAGGAPRPAAAAPERYVLDPAHMSIAFLVSHIGFARTLGMFREASGSFMFDPVVPNVSAISVSIPTASVFTNHAARDNHLQSPDFLDATNHPTITFKGTSATPTGDKTGKVMGDLTIRGVTRPVTLDVTWNRSGDYPFGDRHFAMGISARTKIKRSDFGMTYAVEGGLVGDEVEIILEFEAIRRAS